MDLPKGGFKMVFQPRPVRELPPSIPADVPAPASGWRSREVVLAVLFVLAAISAGYYARRSLKAEAGAAEITAAWTPEVRQLGEPMLTPNRPLVVCFATPLFVR